MKHWGIATALLALSMIVAAPASAESTFEYKMISSPPNSPKAKIGDPATKQLLVALHRGVLTNGLAEATDLPPEDVRQRLQVLETEGLIRQAGLGNHKPAFPVITLAEGQGVLAAKLKPVTATADAIERRLPAIKQRAAQLEGFRHLKFADVSLLVLSNVLLDAFQIGAVEKSFLQKERPRRAGGNYYLALLEKQVGSDIEPLGIYGNQVVSLGDEITGGIYGNRRYAGPMTLARLSTADLESDFGFPANTDVQAAKTQLAKQLVDRWRNPLTKIDSRHEAGLKKLHLLTADGVPLIPIVTLSDQKQLEELTSSFLSELLTILESHRPELQNQFRASIYDDEGVTFEEFFIWWYHVYYTAVTDELIRRGAITVPAAGNATYLVLGN